MIHLDPSSQKATLAEQKTLSPVSQVNREFCRYFCEKMGLRFEDTIGKISFTDYLTQEVPHIANIFSTIVEKKPVREDLNDEEKEIVMEMNYIDDFCKNLNVIDGKIIHFDSEQKKDFEEKLSSLKEEYLPNEKRTKDSYDLEGDRQLSELKAKIEYRNRLKELEEKKPEERVPLLVWIINHHMNQIESAECHEGFISILSKTAESLSQKYQQQFSIPEEEKFPYLAKSINSLVPLARKDRQKQKIIEILQSNTIEEKAKKLESIEKQDGLTKTLEDRIQDTSISFVDKTLLQQELEDIQSLQKEGLKQIFEDLIQEDQISFLDKILLIDQLKDNDSLQVDLLLKILESPRFEIENLVETINVIKTKFIQNLLMDRLQELLILLEDSVPSENSPEVQNLVERPIEIKPLEVKPREKIEKTLSPPQFSLDDFCISLEPNYNHQKESEELQSEIFAYMQTLFQTPNETQEPVLPTDSQRKPVLSETETSILFIPTSTKKITEASSIEIQTENPIKSNNEGKRSIETQEKGTPQVEDRKVKKIKKITKEIATNTDTEKQQSKWAKFLAFLYYIASCLAQPFYSIYQMGLKVKKVEVIG